ncbi:MAG: hypothetical protein OXM02_11705 [Bacteroidota bacterium]|nr:hypothetical protein [Bacteroidota bacterium]
MKKMFRILTVTLAAAAMCVGTPDSGWAQGFGGGGPGNFEARLQAETDSMIALLRPTEEQAEAVKAILDARAAGLAEARPQRGAGRGGFQAAREKMVAVEEQTRVALTSLLSEEQLEAYNAYLERRRDRQRQRGRRQIQ